MLIRKFEIANFKGIKSCELSLAENPPGNVVTLIGLNESGKTTILEAISNFVSADEDTTSIMSTVASQVKPIDLIPKHKKSNFTGGISIKAHITVEDDDVTDVIESIRKEHGVRIIGQKFPRNILVEKKYNFIDSDYKDVNTLWTLSVPYIKKTGTKEHLAKHFGESRPIWLAIINRLRQRFPKIAYFPTFLFSVPDRIYLEDLPEWEGHEEDAVLNRYFRQIMQDVADSLQDNVSINRHIVERIVRHRDGFPNPLTFVAALLGMDEASQIDAVVNRLSGAITRTVFSSWNEIFDQKIRDKRVRVSWGVDSDKGNVPYLQIQINDGEQDYLINERSLGFRWFFTFLLFTQFRKSRTNERGTIFLFDEPASNLHARAQVKLLENFRSNAINNQFIIYSTHSHYMIDPLWLEKSYIVENKAVNVEADDLGISFGNDETDISVARYRQFVHGNPERVSYFQPALDALKFSFGPLVAGERAIIVEGKFDFHPIEYFLRRLKKKSSFGVFPAPSASEAGALISLLRGMGTRFLVVLDDDAAGRRAASVYRRDFLVSDDECVTIGEVLPNLKGKAFEAVYSTEVAALANPSGTPSKGDFSMLFQGLIASNSMTAKLGETVKVVTDLIEGLELRLGLPSGAAPRRRSSKHK